MRQANVSGVHASTLSLNFDKLFEKHMNFLEEDSVKLLIEEVLEKEFTHPYKLELSLSQVGGGESKASSNTDSKSEDFAREFQDFSPFMSDPRVRVLKKIMGATMRNVFDQRPEIQHLYIKDPQQKQQE